MSEWELSKFKDHFSIGLRNGLNKPSRVRGSGVRMVNMKEIFGYDFIDDKTPMELVPVSEKEFQSSNLEYGDLLFARQSLTEAGAGKVAIYRGIQPAVFESHLIRCRINKQKSDPTFLYYLFKSPLGKGAVSTIVHQVAAAGIKGSDLQELEFQFPEIQEQKAIASVLSSLDDKIDLLHRQNTTLEAMAETLFRQWFVEEAQEDWDDVQITKLFDVRDGTHDSPKQKTIGKPLITSKHINGNRLDFESAYLISDDDFDKINQRSKVDKHDILISMIGTIGLIYLEQSDEVNYAIKNVGLFKTSQNKNWMAYTYFWLKSHLGKQFLDEHVSGSTQEYVSLGSFRSITFKKPPIEKLDEFNRMANGYLNKIKNNSAQIQTLEKLRDNLLPKLLSGEVRAS